MATCVERGLGAEYIASMKRRNFLSDAGPSLALTNPRVLPVVIAVGSVCFVALVIGMIIYGVRSNGSSDRTERQTLMLLILINVRAPLSDDNIVVVDKQGRKIRQKKTSGGTGK
jgi:hypothetical protein